MSLELRTQKFSMFERRFTCERPSSLFLIHQIDPELYENLKQKTCIYLSAVLGIKRSIWDENELIERIKASRSNIQNITPNGMVVPKRHLVLEFNSLVKAFVDIVNHLNISDYISSWHIPMNLRFKDGEMVKENMGRKYATEKIHSDSWAGESAESATIMIPLLGDLERNFMSFYEPPPDFQEEWLGPRNSYEDGDEIARRYTRMNVKMKKGYLYLSDFATLHASTRLPGADARVSIDTTFAIKRLPQENLGKEVIHPWRESERLSADKFASIGSENLFFFPNRIGENVDSSGGFKHPTTLKVIDFNPEALR